ncbi:Rhodopsin orphan GPCR [Paragonimus heterotremus]|uniref:Rhodopsin orphan GPCR n=1 Tax=Paragonimus heterotremus TaxID=100268 RepID=A0A8J4TTL1_9TREM|nr:Rhodopsin orphan GPCR [Paragonimus heterotremus]
MYAEVILFDQYRTFLAYLFGGYTCQIRVIVVLCVAWSSNLLQTGLSLERLASIIAPMRTRINSTGRMTRMTITGIVLFSCLSAITITVFSSEPAGPEYFLSNKTGQLVLNYQSLTRCERKNMSKYFTDLDLDWTKVVYNVDLIVFRAIPFITMLISSAVIALLIRRQIRQRTALVSISAVQLTALQYRESRASLLLLTMNLTTLVTNPLFLLFELLDGEGSEGHSVAKLTGDECVSWILRQFFNYLLYFNNQTNWILYIAFGARFRYYIKNMLLCIPKRTRRHSQYTDGVSQLITPTVTTVTQQNRSLRINRAQTIPMRLTKSWACSQRNKNEQSKVRVLGEDRSNSRLEDNNYE